MHLRYENTIDDMVAFSQYHYENSATIKRTIKLYMWGGTTTIFVLLCLMLKKHSFAVNMVAAFIGAGMFALWYTALIQLRKRIMKHQVRNFYSEGKNRGVIGEHELEISADGIIERTLYNETKSAWGAVEKIESNPEYTFIYMNSVTAHVIPTRRIIEGDLSEFLTTLGQHYQPDQQLQQARI